MSTSYDRPPDRSDADQETPDRRQHPEDRDLGDRGERDLGENPDVHDRADGVDRDRVDTPRQPDPQPVTADHVTAADIGLDRRSVVARQRAEFGGVKIGSAFFGWLTATGLAVLLTALVAGIGVAVGLGTDLNANQAANNPQAVSLAGAVALMVILFLSYYCGGYVAARMARFNGARQGLAVWLWALLATIIMAIIAAAAGDKFDVLARLNGFPRLPINEGQLPVAGIVTALALAAVSLVGAILGGLAGMRFHRRVDKAGLEPATRGHADRGASRTDSA